MTLQMGIDAERFATDYWQKRPLLMRQALDPRLFRLTPEELAGLACEAEIESRIVTQRGPTDWLVDHGPFEEASFSSLPASHWTLLVQDVDKFRPDVADLLDAFDFLPGWRIDDIMISFATDQGGVGPHRDAYDVFLMQGHGRRRWRLGGPQAGDDTLVPGLDLRILASFETEHDWILEPGDVLYLPPGVAHWGTALGDCMTYSLGFRATSQRELVSEWFQYRVGYAGDTALEDPAGALAVPNRLGAPLIERARALVESLPGDSGEDFAAWLGGFLTEPKPQFRIVDREQPWDRERLADWLGSHRELLRHPWVRLAWSAMPEGRLALFGNGEHRVVDPALGRLVEMLCARRHVTEEILNGIDRQQALALLLTLVNAGWLEPDDPYDQGVRHL